MFAVGCTVTSPLITAVRLGGDMATGRGIIGLVGEEDGQKCG
jgi:hypothetical protein